MRVVGGDLSLTSTGVATEEGTFVLQPPFKGELRLAWIRDRFAGHCSPLGAKPDLVVLEGYSYASPFQAHQAGELGGVVRLWLFEQEIPFAVVAPSGLKLYATGKGGGKESSKERVLAAAVKRSGIEFRTTDEADAWWLRAMGLDAIGSPLVEMPAANRKALEKVSWPVGAAA